MYTHTHNRYKPADPMYTTAGLRRYDRAIRSTEVGMVAVNITVWRYLCWEDSKFSSILSGSSRVMVRVRGQAYVRVRVSQV